MRAKEKGLGLLLVVLLAGVAWPMSADAQTLGEARRLAGLCEVWGLLKYMHPGAAQSADWDDVAVAAVPKIKAAATKRAFNSEVVRLVANAGLSYVFRELRVGIPRDAGPLGSAFRWIDDATLFEPETQLLLKAIVLAHRPASSRWVSAMSNGASNPNLENDNGQYSGTQYPSEEVRLLALFRFWNMTQYFFPSRDMMDRDWVARLPELVPVFQRAANATEYHLAVAEMTASINDAHAATLSAVLSDYWGRRYVPVQLRLIQERTVVTRALEGLLRGADIRVGDVVTHIDGVPTEVRRAAMKRWVCASNDASLERNVHTYMGHTNNARVTLSILRDGEEAIRVEVDSASSTEYSTELAAITTPTWSILPGNVGYVHMGRLVQSDVALAMAALKNTRAIIFDVRNYPNSTMYEVANYLAASQPFAKFLVPSLLQAGTFEWSKTYTTGIGLPPAPFTYTGRTVVLADQETQSHAEFTVMALQATGALVVGSQTAGADGNVCLIKLPGGVSTYFSGLGVFYPDGRPAQRIGIVPDIVAVPTIRGVREGRDEVLETAIQRVR